MAIILYDLAGRNDVRFSPHCWRTRMALGHKGLAFETRPVSFGEIGTIGQGECKTVPVIEDDGRRVVDSWEIAKYLERTYPDRPSLFGGPGGEALTGFMQNWCAAVLHAGLIGLILIDIYDQLAPEDRDYFRSSREKRFGRPLEDVQAGREERRDGFRASLQPLRMTLQAQPFLGGAGPLYADYQVFGAFQWARTVSAFKVLAQDDPIKAWFERCLDLHGGMGRAHPGHD